MTNEEFFEPINPATAYLNLQRFKREHAEMQAYWREQAKLTRQKFEEAGLGLDS